MVTLTDAVALVPPKEPPKPSEKEVGQILPSSQRLSLMPLEDILDTLVVPRQEDVEAVEWTFSALADRYRKHSKKKRGPNGQQSADDDETSELEKHILRGALEETESDEAEESGLMEMLEDGMEFIEHLLSWGVRKIFGRLVGVLWDGVWDITQWIFRRVVVGGVRMLLEWLVRPLLTGLLEFIGVNPELWPFIALAGGIGALGWLVYDKWFKHDDKDIPGQPKDYKFPGGHEETAAEIAQTNTVADQGMRAVKPATGEVPAVQQATQTEATQGPGVAKPASTKGPVTTGASPPVAAGDAAVTGDFADAKKMIMRHEGVKTKPYKDSLGLWTVGVGHLIGDGKSLPADWDHEFTMDEVLKLFDGDFERHKDAAMKIPNFAALDKKGQGALIDLTFNMGPVWFHKWPHFTAAMAAGDVNAAADSLQNSNWYKQVGSRAVEVVAMLRSSATSTQIGDKQVANSPAVQSPALSKSQLQAANATATNPTMTPPGASNANKTIVQKNGVLMSVAA